MKKMISLLLAMVMVFSIMPVAAFADETAPTIVFETTFTEDMTVGDTFTVTASIEAGTNPGFNSFAFPLIWNEDVLQFDGFNMTYDEDVEEDVLDTVALSAFEPMVYGGSIAGARAKDTKKDGMLFVANFTILAAGDLEIGFLMSNPSDTSKQFQMGNNAGDSLTVAAAENIDDSAIADLAVAGDDEPAAPAVPDGAPFTAVTTDGTGAVVYLSNTTVTYGDYNNVPYYHIQIPADATTVYVTHPASKDPLVSGSTAYGYLATVSLDDSSQEPYVWEHDAMNNGVDLTIYEHVEGSHTTLAYPVEGPYGNWNGEVEGACVVADEDGYINNAVSAENNSNYAPICFFTFEYASESSGGGEGGGEENTTYTIEIDDSIQGGTVSVTDENGTAITEAEAGTMVCLTTDADEEYTLQTIGYTLNDTFVPAENGAFEMPEGDIVVSATFRKNTYTITVNPSENGSVSADKQTAAKDDVVTLTVEPEEGFTLDELTVLKGEETIPVQNNQFTMPAGAVTVSATFKELVKGYTVDMAEDDSFVASEDITVPVTVGHTDSQVEGFNAFEMIFTYDPDVLTLTNESTDELKFQTEGNKITVERYGGDLNVGDTALTLTFTANATGETTVTLEEAYVGVSRELTDAQPASIIDGLTQISITGYSVILPPAFEGVPIAVPGESYTFAARDKFYDYTFEGSTMGDGDVTVIDNGDGTYTIENVSGNIEIEAQETGKLFGITLAADMEHVSGTVKVDDVDKVQYMTNYTAVLTKEDGYTYENFTIAIGDEKNYTGYTSQADEENGTITYTIHGEDIKGDVVFSVTKTEVQPTEFTVTYEGDGAGDAVGAAMAEANKPYSFTLTKADGYTYTVTATMGGEATELTESVDETTGVVTYTTVNVTGNILVTIAKVSDLAVTIHEYIDLNGKTIFLVNATQTLAEGESLSYDGVAMYFSTQYADSQVEGQTGQWSFLVVVDGEFTAETARAAITKGTAEFKTLSQTYDVNMSTKPDINDAQLVYDMYMKEYEDLEHAGMERFLNADVNADKVVDSRDAVAIVEEILK